MSPITISDSRRVKLLGIGGSTRAASRNGAALRLVLEHARSRGAHTDIVDLHASRFPLLNRDRPLADYPDDVARYLKAVGRADGLVLESPTYHGSVSGAFKNALDLLVYGDDAYFGGKPVGLVALGGANGAPVLDMMTTTVHALNGLVVPTRVLVPHGAVSDDGAISDREVAARIDRMIAEVIGIACALRQLETRVVMTTVAGAPLERCREAELHDA